MCRVSVSPRWLSWPNFVAVVGQRPPDELLVKVGAADLGGVDQGHAEVDGPVDRPDRLFVILPRPRVVRRSARHSNGRALAGVSARIR